MKKGPEKIKKKAIYDFDAVPDESAVEGRHVEYGSKKAREAREEIAAKAEQIKIHKEFNAGHKISAENSGKTKGVSPLQEEHSRKIHTIKHTVAYRELPKWRRKELKAKLSAALKHSKYDETIEVVQELKLSRVESSFYSVLSALFGKVDAQDRLKQDRDLDLVIRRLSQINRNTGVLGDG